MTLNENPNLDEMTRLTLRVIELETALDKLTKDTMQYRINADTSWNNTVVPLIGRVSVLEEARQKQRELNSTFVQRGAEPTKTESKKPRFKFW